MGAPFLGLVIGNEQDDWGAERPLHWKPQFAV